MAAKGKRMHNFGPASSDETIVFGSARPGYDSHSVSRRKVEEWVEFMKRRGIERVCCLLAREQLAYYEDLLGVYGDRFGSGNVCWAPINDFQLAEGTLLTEKILPFLASTADRKERVVVHCSAGIGRTGHVLAAWLVHRRGFSPREAINTIETMGRNPYEAQGRCPLGQIELCALLQTCKT